jgi:hypothetical protein
LEPEKRTRESILESADSAREASKRVRKEQMQRDTEATLDHIKAHPGCTMADAYGMHAGGNERRTKIKKALFGKIISPNGRHWYAVGDLK